MTGSRGRKAAQRVWFFDLDNTLHDASYRIFARFDVSMNEFVMGALDVDASEADRLRQHYWERYGSTLLGLTRQHGIDGHAFVRHAHHFVHESGWTTLIRQYPGLRAMLAQLPGRKVLITNASSVYADKVLRHLDIDRHFARRYGVEQMFLHGRFLPKPSRAMLRMLLARERVVPSRAILVEDSPENLKSARAIGMKTVFVTQSVAPVGRIRKSRPPYVDVQVKSVRHLLKYQRLLG